MLDERRCSLCTCGQERWCTRCGWETETFGDEEVFDDDGDAVEWTLELSVPPFAVELSCCFHKLISWSD